MPDGVVATERGLGRCIGGAAFVDDPGGEAVDDVGSVDAFVGDAVSGREVDGGCVVAFSYDIGIDDGFGVGDGGVDAGVEGFLGVHGRCHDAFECLDTHGVAVVGTGFGNDEVAGSGNIDVGCGGGLNLAEGYIVVQVLLVAGAAGVAVGGYVPGVGEHAFGGAEGVDGSGFAGGATGGGDLHRLAAASDVGVDGVDVVDAVAGVHFYAHRVVDVVDKADGYAGPGFVAVAAGGAAGGCAGTAFNPRGGEGGAERGCGHVVPKAVVDGEVVPLSGGVVFAADANEEFSSLLGCVVETTGYNGIVDEEECIL